MSFRRARVAMEELFFFCPVLRNVFSCVLAPQKSDWTALEGTNVCFVVFFGVGRMADLTRFCRLVEFTFSQEGTLSGKMLLHPETFGAPPCFEQFLS